MADDITPPEVDSTDTEAGLPTGQAGGEAASEAAVAQKKIDEAIGETIRQRAELKETNARLLAAIEGLERAKTPAPTPDLPPKRDDFASYEEYLEASRLHADREIKAYVDERIAYAREDSVQLAKEGERFTRMQHSAQRGEAAYPGFTEAIKTIQPLPSAALQAWQELEEPEHVAHYLAAQPAEAAKIALMSPGRAAHAIYALEETLKGKRGKAPESVSFGPMSAAPSPQNDPDNMTMNEYAAWRTKQMVKKARGG